MNNSYVLEGRTVSFNRPNNTTPYSAFAINSNGSAITIPAPTRFQPFYIRRINVQIMPGFSATNNYALFLYTQDPAGTVNTTDGGFINQTNAVNADILEARIAFTMPAGTNLGILDVFPVNLSVNAPTGAYYGLLETGTAFTPTANQLFKLKIYTEYAN